VRRILIGLAAAAAIFVVLAAPASAQTPPPQPPAAQAPPAQAAPPSDQAPTPQLRSPIEGDLVSVDPEAKKITVKPTSGANLVFMYTDTTVISGDQKDAAGLATLKEGRVTVHFTEDAKTKAKTATRIVVQPKQ
jgi:Cu/Ag efflux protein CusF